VRRSVVVVEHPHTPAVAACPELAADLHEGLYLGLAREPLPPALEQKAEVWIHWNCSQQAGPAVSPGSAQVWHLPQPSEACGVCSHGAEPG